jgi:hypothetical protein
MMIRFYSFETGSKQIGLILVSKWTPAQATSRMEKMKELEHVSNYQ